MSGMGELVVDILEWMRTLTPLWLYVVILAVSYGENLVPPVPGDLVVVFGGYLAGVGHLDYPVVVLLATVGGAAGFMTVFWFGHRFGDAALAPDRLKWLPKHRVYRVRQWLLRYGYIIVGVNRFLSGLRSVISLTVGAAQMHTGRTAVFATLSALTWTALIAYVGVVVGENWESVSVYLQRYSQAIASLVLLLVVALVVRRLRRRKRRQELDERQVDSRAINSGAD